MDVSLRTGPSCCWPGSPGADAHLLLSPTHLVLDSSSGCLCEGASRMGPRRRGSQLQWSGSPCRTPAGPQGSPPSFLHRLRPEYPIDGAPTPGASCSQRQLVPPTNLRSKSVTDGNQYRSVHLSHVLSPTDCVAYDRLRSAAVYQ